MNLWIPYIGFATQRRLDYHRNHTHTDKQKIKLKCDICSKVSHFSNTYFHDENEVGKREFFGIQDK